VSTIKVFKLDDCDWWAGESLEVCIAEGRLQCGADCYEDAETEGVELDDEGMRRLKIYLDEDRKEKPISFAEHLANEIAGGTKFPCLFASTEW